jgi:hypothetical protein
MGDFRFDEEGINDEPFPKDFGPGVIAKGKVECSRCRGGGVTVEKDYLDDSYDQVQCPVCHGAGVTRDNSGFDYEIQYDGAFFRGSVDWMDEGGPLRDTDLLAGINDLFAVTEGPVGYNVYLPHQCDSWDVVENATRDEAIDAMIKFIREARKALVQLQTNGAPHSTRHSARPNLLAILTERTSQLDRAEIEITDLKMELLRWKLAH